MAARSAAAICSAVSTARLSKPHRTAPHSTLQDSDPATPTETDRPLPQAGHQGHCNKRWRRHTQGHLPRRCFQHGHDDASTPQHDSLSSYHALANETTTTTARRLGEAATKHHRLYGQRQVNEANCAGLALLTDNCMSLPEAALRTPRNADGTGMDRSQPPRPFAERQSSAAGRPGWALCRGKP
jgi:hypothetical protein